MRQLSAVLLIALGALLFLDAPTLRRVNARLHRWCVATGLIDCELCRTQAEASSAPRLLRFPRRIPIFSRR